MTKKELAIKDINIQEMKANWRSWIIVAVFTSLVVGAVIGYFVSINVITDSQAKAIDAISKISSLKQ